MTRHLQRYLGFHVSENDVVGSQCWSWSGAAHMVEEHQAMLLWTGAPHGSSTGGLLRFGCASGSTVLLRLLFLSDDVVVIFELSIIGG